jgi:hypothetical protein
MRIRACFTGVILLASIANAGEPISFDSPRWEITAQEHRIEEYKGKTALYLKGGLALVKDAEFTDGVIEYWCAIPETRGFAGASWRIQDASNREEFYIRAHQSGNPDANQYSPIFNGISAWQLYHGEGYGAPVEYEFDTWFPVRIVVSGDQAEIFIGDLETPALFIDDLKREKASGSVGLNVANFGPARFADFSYQAMEAPELKGRVEREREAPEGAVMRWQVSSSFSEENIDGVMDLAPELTEGRTWTALDTESTGLANLSRVNPVTREANTVFAKLTVVAEAAQAKTIEFGYSDRLRLFVNGTLVYTGDNGYRTRDYRYLGTIGYFDAVTVPLQKGTNDVVFAVSESFGGWGVQAAIPERDGISVE